MLWSDTQCVLHWIKKPQKHGTFVDRRLNEIRTLSLVEYRYVDAGENPSDTPSRGATVDTLKNNKNWWHGPQWINNEKGWPSVLVIPANAVQLEKSANTLLAAAEGPTKYPMIINLERYSSWGKLIRVSAYVLRTIECMRGNKCNGFLTSQELKNATMVWL